MVDGSAGVVVICPAHLGSVCDGPVPHIARPPVMLSTVQDSESSRRMLPLGLDQLCWHNFENIIGT